MTIDTNDIRKDFNNLSNINYKWTSVGALYDSLNANPKNRGFSIIRREFKKAFGMQSPENIKLFAECIKDNGNIEYSRRVAEIGKEKALKIIYILNVAAIKRGLPPIYTFANKSIEKAKERAKLHPKQVSYIKYLATKYSANKLSKIYKVSASTINNIKVGLHFKDIRPCIPINADLRRPKTFIIKSEKEADSILNYIIWENNPTCPRCKTNNPYPLRNYINTQFRCKNPTCKSDFSLKTGTPLENSKVKNITWVNAMFIYNKNNQITSTKLAFDLGVTQKTSYNIILRLKDLYLTLAWKRFINNYVVDFKN